MIDQQPLSQSLLDEVLIGVIALCVLLALVVVVSRVQIARHAESTRHRLAPLRPDLLAVAAGEDDSGEARDRLVTDRDGGVDLERSVVVVEWGRGMAEELADSWWDIEVERPVGSSDDLDPSELDSDAPRIVTIVRESAA